VRADSRALLVAPREADHARPCQAGQAEGLGLIGEERWLKQQARTGDPPSTRGRVRIVNP
jgi:hypothetical protein